jgi:uncharacterized membrane protein YoaK (UPF0700 family)
MLKHTGIHRTHIHNVRLAVLLSLTAGLVNAEGFLGFAVLTTNVTGHAAFFAEKASINDWSAAWVIALWMLSFLGGAFLSGAIISVIGKNQRYSYLLPVLLAITILVAIALAGHHYQDDETARRIFAGSLLFAMGMQNALVTVVSGSVVRTTHLTGTFTDLGIELARMLVGPRAGKAALKPGILLKTLIIFFFIAGALGGAYVFRSIGFSSFFLPAFILVFALVYDIVRVNVKRYYRKIESSIKGTH